MLHKLQIQETLAESAEGSKTADSEDSDVIDDSEPDSDATSSVISKALRAIITHKSTNINTFKKTTSRSHHDIKILQVHQEIVEIHI
jgi:hypothetical protein